MNPNGQGQSRTLFPQNGYGQNYGNGQYNVQGLSH